MTPRDRVSRLRLAQILREAESREHRRIQNLLENHATSLGYEAPASLANGLRPDVLRLDGDYLFLADAKVAENETASRADSAIRISQYVFIYASLIKVGAIRGGVIGVATNDLDAANEWAQRLEDFCRENDLSDADGVGPSFSVEALDASTWFAYW